MSTVVGPPEDVAAIGLVAGRIRRFAEAVAQGHGFDIGPGEWDRPWTVEFQMVAVPVYATALPWEYLVRLASGFDHCAQLMVTVAGPKAAATEWGRMQEYLRSAGTAIREQAPDKIEITDVAAGDVDDTTPPVMPFRLLAEMISHQGVADLRAAGAAIEQSCGPIDQSPLTEQEVAWLRRLAAGERVIDVATTSGYSERALYRALSDLWARLGVDNHNEAMTLAARNGWI